MVTAKGSLVLPLLESIRIASPCSADWSAMVGDDRVRHCGECQQNVFNLSVLTREEAEQLVREHTGRQCVRFFRRADGTILTADCPVGLARIRQRVARLAVISLAAAASFLIGTLTACGYALGIHFENSGGLRGIFSGAHQSPYQGGVVMGEMCVPPIPPSGVQPIAPPTPTNP